MQLPKIEFDILPDRWTALGDEQSKDLLEVALTQKKGDKRPDPKIRIANEFIDRSRVKLQQTDYFASLMTDQLAWQRVRSKSVKKDGMTPEVILWDGASAFINKISGELMSLDDVSLSNQVGASLLGFSSEGHMMIVYQNDKNNQSANTLAPAGSGSLDWEDVTDSKAQDFLSLIKFGAERELREECALDVNKKDKLRISSSVMLTGFARMLHRGGKPEFYGLARMGATAAEIKGRKPERYVDKVVESGVRPADFLNNRPSQELIRVCKAYLEKVFQIGEFRVPLSYPLEHALNLTIEVCSMQETAVAIDHFMQKPLT